MAGQFTRRDFLGQTATAGAALLTGSLLRPLQAGISPNEKLNIAAIGTSNRAGADISGCASENIVALCDIDANLLDKATGTYQAARKYSDWRVMLEKEGDKIDAVIVGTPDHCHAPAAAMALKMGKHVYCEKPLTHTVFEARTLAKLAAEHKAITQMGNQIHSGENYRRVVELVESGSIGPVAECHVWVGVNYAGGKFVEKPTPAGVDWNLWLGPAPKRPYVEATIGDQPQKVHPFYWRWFWDYGTGGLGDFGCHYMDLPFWALGLRHPTHISAQGPAVQPDVATAGLTVEYKYPARGDKPPVTLTWYDGGKRPELLSQLKDNNGQPLNWGSGVLFVGEKGWIVSNYGEHLLLPKNSGEELKRPEPYIAPSPGQHQEWIQAIKTGGKPLCNFDYAGALTEATMLGVVAYRSGEALKWDGPKFELDASSTARDLLHKEYRQGWTL